MPLFSSIPLSNISQRLAARIVGMAIVLIGLFALIAKPIFAQSRAGELSEICSAEFQQRREAASGQPFQAAARVSRTVIYGEHQRQQVNVYESDDVVDELPLVLFIHGGAWSAGSHQGVGGKPAHFNATGYYFASTGYRLLPYAPVEQQAADIGAAIQALRGQASAIGFDPDQIVLIGHSAGAHLAALVATDPSYAGDAFDAIQGVILLDSAGYDVAARLAMAEPSGWQTYNSVFGRDPERQAALSPITHIGGPDAPNWLALYMEEREASRVQALAFTAALSETGVQAIAQPITNTNHGRLNRELGTEAGAQQTQAIDAFLARVFD